VEGDPFGLPFLRELLAAVAAQGRIPAELLPTARAVLDALGIGIGPGLGLIYANLGSPERFEQQLVESVGGRIDPMAVELARELIEGAAPGGERARQSEALRAAAPVLDAADLAHWHEHGYVVVRDAAPPEACAELAAAIWREVGADPDDPDTWVVTGLTQGLMVPLHHAPGIPEIHASLRIRRAFAELLGTDDLVMTADRCGFNAPLRHDGPWHGPRLHHDLESFDPPIGLAVQGILYLTDTSADQGALRVVPGFHHRIDEWIASLPRGSDPTLEDLEAFGPVPIAAPANSLVIWHHALPHGPGPNRAELPRIVHYLTMYAPPPPLPASAQAPGRL
jgi:hypothetical protein